MRKTRNIIIFVLVIGLLIGAYFFLANRPEDEPEEIVSDTISVYKSDKNEIKKIELSSINGELTINRIEKEVEEGEGDNKELVLKTLWEVDYEHDVILKQMSIDDIAYTFASLNAERIIEEETPDNLEPYGLKEPQAKGTATLDDGSKRTLYLGNKTPSGSTYYLMVEGDPKVYEVWTNHGDRLLYTLSDIRDKTIPFIDLNDFRYLYLDKGDGRPLEIKINDDISGEDAQFGIGIWQMTRPYNEPMGVNGEAIHDMLEGIQGFTIEEFIEDGVEDLSKYGLDEPSLEFIFMDGESKTHMIFGDEYDEKYLYFKLPDSDSVFGIRKSLTNFADIRAFDLVEKFAYIVNIDDVDKIEVEGFDKSHVLSMEREIIKEAEDEDEEDEVETTYFLDGVEVQDKAFKKAYQSVIGVLVDGENIQDMEEKPEVKTTFYLNKGSNREVSINYVPYDSDFYAVFRGGQAEFVVNKGLVKNIFDMAEALAKGELDKE